MDDKTLTAVSTRSPYCRSNSTRCCSCWSVRHPTAQIREDFQQLVNEGVQAVGRETMESIKSRIVQQDIEGLGLDKKD